MRPTRLHLLLLQDGRPLYIIAGELHIHPSTLSQYSRGHLSIRSHHLATLSSYFSLPPSDILGYATFDHFQQRPGRDNVKEKSG